MQELSINKYEGKEPENTVLPRFQDWDIVWLYTNREDKKKKAPSMKEEEDV